MDKSVTEIIEDVKEDICDKYCKYPLEYLAEIKDPDLAHELMLETKCKNCPLQRL